MSTLPVSIYQPGRPACRGVVGTLLSTPSCVSGHAPGLLDRWLYVATWLQVVAASYYTIHITRTSIGRTHVLCSCCTAYLWSASLPHIYHHMIIPPRPSLFFTFPFPAKLKRAHNARKREGWEPRLYMYISFLRWNAEDEPSLMTYCTIARMFF